MENRDPVVHLDRSFWSVTALLVVLSVLGIYAWIVAPISTWLPEAVDKAEQIDALFRFLAASGTVLFIIVGGYLLYFTIAYRRRASDPPDAIGIQIHDNHMLELWWTLIPSIFVVVMAFFSIVIWHGIQYGNPSNGLVVESLGHQWYYTFRYPGVHGEVTQEMHLPVNTPVTLHVTSYDVIHSFWVPDMRLKADMVPGIINTIRFTPTTPGRYKIVCTEFCGTEHGTMDKQIMVVESQAQYNAWLTGWQRKNANVSDEIQQASTGTIDLSKGVASNGAQLFTQKCSACHAMAPFTNRIVGPGLKGVMSDRAHPKLVNGDDATPANVAKILQQGYKGDMGIMPDQTANGLSDKDIADLVAYLNSMK